VVTILNQIYEVDFKGFSYGFRPGRSPHQALDALTVGIQRKKVNWINRTAKGGLSSVGFGTVGTSCTRTRSVGVMPSPRR
jgi:retron-type reverse transcriptase